MKKTAAILSVLFIIFDTCIRQYKDAGITILGKYHDIYNAGTMLSVLLITTIPLFISKGINKPIAFFLFSVGINNLVDTEFSQTHCVIEWNDILVYGLGIAAGALYSLKYKPKLNIDTFGTILLAGGIIKIITANSMGYSTYHVNGVEYYRYYYNIGNAALYLTTAIYIAYQLLGYVWPVAISLFVFCAHNYLDNQLYDPGNFTLHEKVFTVLYFVAVVVAYGILKFTKKRELKQYIRYND